MSHEIDMSTGAAAIAYVGEKPWHGLGQELTANAPIEVWKREAKMDWEIQGAPVMFGVPTEFGPEPTVFEGKKVLYRGDTKSALSIVSDKYKIVQPGEVLEFFRDLVGAGGMQLETAGCLFGGKQFWALAKTNYNENVIKNDAVRGMLLLTSSCDGSVATVAKFTSVRVVCNNTLTMSMAETLDRKNISKTRHNTTFDPAKIKDHLGLIDRQWNTFMDNIRVMADRKISDASAKQFLAESLLTAEQFKEFRLGGKISHQAEAMLGKAFGLYAGNGMGSDVAGKTLWGALNAVTEMVDHHGSKRASVDNQFWNTYLGLGDKLKTRAYELAGEYV